jgi:hypothetical protein
LAEPAPKPKIRNPKSEIRRKSETRNPNVEIAKLPGAGHAPKLRLQAAPYHAATAPNKGPAFGFRISDFGFRISGLRASDHPSAAASSAALS